jgi:hypothetical protein
MKPALRRKVHSPRLVRIGVVGAVLAAAAGAGSLAYATILVNQSVTHGCAARSGAQPVCRALRARKGRKELPGLPAQGAPGVIRDVIGGGDAGCDARERDGAGASRDRVPGTRRSELVDIHDP